MVPIRPLADRRAVLRLEVVGPLWGTLEQQEWSQVIDISRAGVLIASPVPLAIGSEHTLQFGYGSAATRVEARVRRCEDAAALDAAHYLIGLEFTSSSVSLDALIDELTIG
jgi:hypothetical protein